MRIYEMFDNEFIIRTRRHPVDITLARNQEAGTTHKTANKNAWIRKENMCVITLHKHANAGAN